MAAKSVIDIEVNDAEFKRFEESFRKYNETLTKQPAAWQKTGKEAHTLSESFKVMSNAMTAQVMLLQKIADNTNKFASASKDAATHWKDIEQHSKGVQVGGFAGVGGTGGGMFGGIGAMAAGMPGMLLGGLGMIGGKIVSAVQSGFEVVKGIGFGLAGLGTGGMMGLDRLGAAGYSGLRASSGIGQTYGAMKANQNVFGTQFNPDAVMQAVSTARGDRTSHEYSALQSLGISGSRGTAGDTLLSVREKAYQMAHSVPEGGWGARLRSSRLGEMGVGIEDLRRFQGQSRADFDKDTALQKKRAEQFDADKEALKKWQNFYRQLDAATTKIESGLLKGLESVAPLLTTMSEGLSDAISNFLKSKQFGEAVSWATSKLQWLADYLGGDQVKKDLEYLWDQMKEFADWFKKTLPELKAVVEWITHPAGKTLEAVTGIPLAKQEENQNAANQRRIDERNDRKRFLDDLYYLFTGKKGNLAPDIDVEIEEWSNYGTPAAKKGARAGRSRSGGRSTFASRHGGGGGGDGGGADNGMANLGGGRGSGAGGYAGGGDVMKGDIEYFMSQGWTYEQATGIVANIKDESSGSGDVYGDAGLAYGLAQWHPDRRANFKKLFGYDMTDKSIPLDRKRRDQRQFINWELNNTEANAGKMLRGQTTVEGSSAAVSKYYERPGAVAEAQRNRAATGAAIAAQHPRSSLTNVKIDINANTPSSVQTAVNQSASAQ